MYKTLVVSTEYKYMKKSEFKTFVKEIIREVINEMDEPEDMENNPEDIEDIPGEVEPGETGKDWNKFKGDMEQEPDFQAKKKALAFRHGDAELDESVDKKKKNDKFEKWKKFGDKKKK